MPDAPDVMTYHAYALSVLRNAGCRASVIHASDERKLMRQVLVHVGLLDESHVGSVESRAAVRAALALVSRVKNYQTSQAWLSPAQQATVNSYNAGLSARGWISFDDMVPMATEVLLSSAATPRFTHILLDEAQDTSESQLRLLQLLAPRGHTVITAVGDADQSIFAFRGAKASATWLQHPACLPAIAVLGDAGITPVRALTRLCPTLFACRHSWKDHFHIRVYAASAPNELPLLLARGGGGTGLD